VNNINLVSSLEKKRMTKKDKAITCIQVPLTGIAVGIMVTIFIYIASKVIKLSSYLIDYSNLSLIISAIFVVVLGASATIINHKVKGYIGNGIDILTQYYYGNNDFNPYRLLMFTMVNSFIAFFFGFTLGTEAPAVTIGASVAKIGNKGLRKYDRDIIMAGGSSGFASAFIAPVAGFLHLLEEHKQRINKWFLLKGFVMIAFAYLTTFIIQSFIWERGMFYSMNIVNVPARRFYTVIYIAIFSFGIGEFYEYMHSKASRLRGSMIMLYVTPILALGFYLLKRFYPLVTGNGDALIESSILDKGLLVIFLIMLVRFIFMLISENANISGGSVLPLLALGALMGEFIVRIVEKRDPTIVEYEETIKVVGMFCCLGCAANIPITSYVLALETTHSYQILLPLGVALIFIEIFKKLINLPFIHKYRYRIELDNNDII